MSWAERLGVEVDALMVLQRHDAEDAGAADVVRSAAAVYLVGDSSMHLRSALKETPVFAAIGDVLAGGRLVVAVGPARPPCATRCSTSGAARSRSDSGSSGAWP